LIKNELNAKIQMMSQQVYISFKRLPASMTLAAQQGCAARCSNGSVSIFKNATDNMLIERM